MNPEQLLAYFDRIAEAPDAVPRLRRFILDLAVRGKLVEQDPNDEPASELLKRNKAEKARLVRAGEIREKPWLPTVAEEEMPFAIPIAWRWCRFANLADFSAGRTPSRNDLSFWNSGEHAWVSIADMQDGQVITDTKETVSDRAREHVFGANPEPPGTILMSFKLTIGKIARLGIPAFHNEAIISIRPFLGDLDAYLFRVLPGFARQGDTKGAIKGATLNRDSISNILLPLPPLAEQHRIVAKVDELMALCNRLEAAQTKREQRRDRLVAASLNRINQPAPSTAGEAATAFREHARFHLDHLPRLTTRPEHIKSLRQTILNLAVRGKLVEQDPEEGGGTALLSLLKRERAIWEEAGRIRKEKGDRTAILDEEKYLDVPQAWAWARLLELGQTQTGTSPSSANPDLFGSFIPFIKPADLDGKEINYDGPGLSESGMGCSRLAAADSVLMVCIGATLGKVNRNTRPICFNQQINSLTPFLDGLSEYLALALKASGFQALAWSKAGTGTLPIISKGKWEILPVPIPPLAEQHRIVAKVDELMAVCAQLETQLETTQTDSRRLLEAVLHEALAPAMEEAA